MDLTDLNNIFVREFQEDQVCRAILCVLPELPILIRLFDRWRTLTWQERRQIDNQVKQSFPSHAEDLYFIMREALRRWEHVMDNPADRTAIDITYRPFDGMWKLKEDLTLMVGAINTEILIMRKQNSPLTAEEQAAQIEAIRKKKEEKERKKKEAKQQNEEAKQKQDNARRPWDGISEDDKMPTYIPSPTSINRVLESRLPIKVPQSASKSDENTGKKVYRAIIRLQGQKSTEQNELRKRKMGPVPNKSEKAKEAQVHNEPKISIKPPAHTETKMTKVPVPNKSKKAKNVPVQNGIKEADKDPIQNGSEKAEEVAVSNKSRKANASRPNRSKKGDDPNGSYKLKDAPVLNRSKKGKDPNGADKEKDAPVLKRSKKVEDPNGSYTVKDAQVLTRSRKLKEAREPEASKNAEEPQMPNGSKKVKEGTVSNRSKKPKVAQIQNVSMKAKRAREPKGSTTAEEGLIPNEEAGGPVLNGSEKVDYMVTQKRNPLGDENQTLANIEATNIKEAEEKALRRQIWEIRANKSWDGISEDDKMPTYIPSLTHNDAVLESRIPLLRAKTDKFYERKPKKAKVSPLPMKAEEAPVANEIDLAEASPIPNGYANGEEAPVANEIDLAEASPILNGYAEEAPYALYGEEAPVANEFDLAEASPIPNRPKKTAVTPVANGTEEVEVSQIPNVTEKADETPVVNEPEKAEETQVANGSEKLNKTKKKGSRKSEEMATPSQAKKAKAKKGSVLNGIEKENSWMPNGSTEAGEVPMTKRGKKVKASMPKKEAPRPKNSKKGAQKAKKEHPRSKKAAPKPKKKKKKAPNPKKGQKETMVLKATNKNEGRKGHKPYKPM